MGEEKIPRRVAVLFEVKPAAEGMKRYLELAASLKEVLAGAEGKLLSMNVWESEEATRHGD